MKCDRCDKDASIEIHVTSENHKSNLNLCVDCYQKILKEKLEKKKEVGEDFHFFSEVLAELLSSVLAKETNLDFDSDKVCPTCSKSLADLVRAGKLGCPDCYTTFHPQIKGILQNTLGSSQHMGTHPEEFEKIDQINKEIQDLRVQMEDFVLVEDYEHAQEVKLKIEELNSTIKTIKEDANDKVD